MNKPFGVCLLPVLLSSAKDQKGVAKRKGRLQTRGLKLLDRCCNAKVRPYNREVRATRPTAKQYV